MKKRAIPNPSAGSDLRPAVMAIKENLEVITAQRADPIADLATTATTAQIIAKINEILERLQ